MKHGTELTVKFLKLKRRLGLPLWQCKGLLESLWNLTAASAPEGDIGRFSNEDIAASIEWKGDENELINALVETKWLHTDSEYRLYVHDWSDHAPNFVKGNFTKHNKKFADEVARERSGTEKAVEISTREQNTPSKTLPSKGGGEKKASSTPATKPNQTNSYQTKPNQDSSTPEPVGSSSECSKGKSGRKKTKATYPDAFERWWLAYPKARRVSKKKTFEAWKRAGGRVREFYALSSEQAAELLQDRVEAYAKSPAGGKVKFVPYSFRWLDDERYDDDDEAWGDLSDTGPPVEDPKERQKRLAAGSATRRADAIIRAGKKAGLDEDQIRAQLDSEGLEWPKAFLGDAS